MIIRRIDFYRLRSTLIRNLINMTRPIAANWNLLLSVQANTLLEIVAIKQYGHHVFFISLMIYYFWIRVLPDIIIIKATIEKKNWNKGFCTMTPSLKSAIQTLKFLVETNTRIARTDTLQTNL